jgi:hypothetical protein
MTKRILIIGGYGIFGGRLAQLLADDERLELVIAGRSKDKAEDFCKHHPSRANKVPLLFNRDGDIESQLQEIRPELVVDATGPFQSYGPDPYRVVKACLVLAIDYMDLADGSDFVNGISQFDDEAKRRHLFILSGVSSFPVLTAAVVRQLSNDLQCIHTITGGIAPSPYAGVGLNVIRAIASYAGKPVALVRDGHASTGYALTESTRYTICPPGQLPLNNIRFSLVDVPDLRVIPGLYADLDSIWMGAGPVPELLHRALNGLAWLVRLKIISSLSPFARLFYFVINIVRWGEHRGGMFIAIEGTTADKTTVKRSWHLLAEGDDGPFIPSMAIEAILRRCSENKRPLSGARPATSDLEIEDYNALFTRRTIYTGYREETENTHHLCLYQRVLGDAWSRLPPALQAMHSARSAEGTATIERGSSLLSKLIVVLFGFPPTGQDVPVSVEFQLHRNGEAWRRTFGCHSFVSFQYEGKGRSERLLCERFGPFTFGLAAIIEGDDLRLVIRRWSLFGLPMPAFLQPDNNSYEFVDDGVFHFHVEIGHWITGPIVHYRGHLIPCERTPALAKLMAARPS